LVVTGEMANDAMTLQCETGSSDDALKTAIIGSIRDITKLRGDVIFVTTGSLANDGKVIDDARKYE
jgi:phenylacetate-CoA ligase